MSLPSPLRRVTPMRPSWCVDMGPRGHVYADNRLAVGRHVQQVQGRTCVDGDGVTLLSRRFSFLPQSGFCEKDTDCVGHSKHMLHLPSQHLPRPPLTAYRPQGRGGQVCLCQSAVPLQARQHLRHGVGEPVSVGVLAMRCKLPRGAGQHTPSPISCSSTLPSLSPNPPPLSPFFASNEASPPQHLL